MFVTSSTLLGFLFCFLKKHWDTGFSQVVTQHASSITGAALPIENAFQVQTLFNYAFQVQSANQKMCWFPPLSAVKIPFQPQQVYHLGQGSLTLCSWPTTTPQHLVGQAVWGSEARALLSSVCQVRSGTGTNWAWVALLQGYACPDCSYFEWTDQAEPRYGALHALIAPVWSKLHMCSPASQ